MTSAAGDLDAWFDAFVHQSFRPEAFGRFGWKLPLPGGLTGAGVAVGLAEFGPIVLKWGPLARILKEAEARRDLAEQDVEHQGVKLEELRANGASHVAIREMPDRKGKPVLYGIIAAKYEGSMDPEQQPWISDFQELIRDVYVHEGATGSDHVRHLMRQVAVALTAEPPPQAKEGQVSQLADLRPEQGDANAGIRARARAARAVLRKRRADIGALGNLDDWIERRLRYEVPRGAMDSRVVHGDPRFANIVVDRMAGTVALIDFGEGGAGRHLFHDFARFEADIILRTTEAGGPERFDELKTRVRIAQTRRTVAKNAARASRVAGFWREARNANFPALHEDKPLDLYALFLVKELLTRIRWWGKPDRTVDEVGATPAELAAAINYVRETIEEREGRAVARRWANARRQELDAVLHSWGVSMKRWGAAGAKSSADLLAELREGESELVVDELGLARSVRAVWVDVFATDSDGRRRRLVEARQVKADGSPFRQRTLPASIGEKAKRGEHPRDAALRGLAEELGIRLAAESLRDAEPGAFSGGSSYPGLRTRYEHFWFTVELPPDQYRAEGYVEHQDTKTTYFEWET